MHADSRLRADLALVLVAIFWGVTFPLIRGAMDELTPAQFVGWRFTLAALAFLPLLLGSRSARQALPGLVGPGILLGLIAGLSYFTQTWGLQTVPAGRAAFITALNVVIVPLLAPLFRAGRPSALDCVAALVATGGLYLMTIGEEGLGAGLVAGDFWILTCATAYAVYLLVLQKVLERDRNPVALAFAQIAAVALIADVFLVGDGTFRIPLSAWVLSALIFCATLATVATFWLQARFQGQTTAQRAALVFALEPVFATGFAWLLLGETIGWIGALGAVVVLGAVLGVELIGSRSEG